jgi:hypothetical protein
MSHLANCQKERCPTHQPRGQDHTVTEQQEVKQVEDTCPERGDPSQVH